MGNIELYHGRLGKDANVRDTSAGEIAELNLACDFWTDGKKESHWFKVKVWRPSQAVKHLQKGDEVLVYSAPYTVEKWTGRDGDERETLVLTAIRLEIMPGRNGESRSEPAPATKPPQNRQPPGRPAKPSDDIPF